MTERYFEIRTATKQVVRYGPLPATWGPITGIDPAIDYLDLKQLMENPAVGNGTAFLTHADALAEGVPIESLDAAVFSYLELYAVEQRDANLVSGILVMGHGIPTDEMGRGLVAGAYTRAIEDSTLTKRWQVSNRPIQFVTFDNEQLRFLGRSMDAFVQSVFDTVDAAQVGISAGTITTPQQIDALYAGLQRVFAPG